MSILSWTWIPLPIVLDFGYEFESRFRYLLAGFRFGFRARNPEWNSDLNSGKKGWIQIQLNSDLSCLDSDSKFSDQHITDSEAERDQKLGMTLLCWTPSDHRSKEYRPPMDLQIDPLVFDRWLDEIQLSGALRIFAIHGAKTTKNQTPLVGFAFKTMALIKEWKCILKHATMYSKYP